MIKKPFSEDQAMGMLVGLAVGDALGAAVEGKTRGSFSEIDDMIGGGRHTLCPGQWAEATSMAMCLAQMLRSANGWDVEDAMKRFINWRDYGYLSSKRVCFGMGPQTENALRRYEKTGVPYAGVTDESENGNSGIMRLAPVVLAYGASKASAMAVAQLQSRITHASPLCQRAAANLAQFLVTGDRSLLPVPDEPPEEASDDVMGTFHAAFWALGQGSTFKSTLLAAVNLGGDADRIGAVTGQIAGRIYGYEAIPGAWRVILHDHDKIKKAAEDLHVMRPIDM